MLNEIPIVKIVFVNELQKFNNIEELGAYTVNDAIRGIRAWYPEFEIEILKLQQQGYGFRILINSEYLVFDLEDLNVLLPYEKNTIEIIPTITGQGNVGKIILGVGIATGLGFLGVISWTAVGLLGASLVFSSIFKHPQTNTDEEAEKRSTVFTGAINTTNSGNCLPLCFGECWVGSIVASAHITPDELIQGTVNPQTNTNTLIEHNDTAGISYINPNPDDPVKYFNPDTGQYEEWQLRS